MLIRYKEFNKSLKEKIIDFNDGKLLEHGVCLIDSIGIYSHLRIQKYKG